MCRVAAALVVQLYTSTHIVRVFVMRHLKCSNQRNVTHHQLIEIHGFKTLR